MAYELASDTYYGLGVVTCIRLSIGQSGEHHWADQAMGSGVEVSFTHR